MKNLLRSPFLVPLVILSGLGINCDCAEDPVTGEAAFDLEVIGPGGPVQIGSDFLVKTIVTADPNGSPLKTSAVAMDPSVAEFVEVTIVAGYENSNVSDATITWGQVSRTNEANYIYRCLQAGETTITVRFDAEQDQTVADFKLVETVDVRCIGDDATTSDDDSGTGDTGDDASDVSASGTGNDTEEDDTGATTGGDDYPSADIYTPTEFSESVGGATMEADGTLTPFDDPFASGGTATAGAYTPNGSHIVTGGPAGFSTMSRAADGTLTWDAPITLHYAVPGAMKVTPDGQTLLVSDINDDALSAYDLDADAVPSNLQTVPAGVTPRQIAVDSDSSHAYVAYGGLGGGGVQTFSLSGAAPTLENDDGPFPNPIAVGMSPDESCLYLGTGSGIQVFERAGDGTLTDTGETFASSQIGSLAVTPDDAFIVASRAFDQTVFTVARGAGCSLEAQSTSEADKIGFNGEISRALSTPDGYVVFEADAGGGLRADFVDGDGLLNPGPVVQTDASGGIPIVIVND